MQESGVDLEFDTSISEDVEHEFYEIQSRTLDDVISKPTPQKLAHSADDILTELFNKERMSTLSRTQQKLQLQREHLLKQEQKKKEQERQRKLEQSAEVSIPFTRQTETVSPHLPPAMVKFQTKLENPTKYHVIKTQERMLKEYINQHGSTHSRGFPTSAPQPTLNAINNMVPIAGDNYGLSGGVKPPDSPMSATSSTGKSEVEDILDDIISLEDDSAVAAHAGLGHSIEDFFGLPPGPGVVPATASLSDMYGTVRNMQPSAVADTISSSCPPKIKQEPVEGKYNHASYLKDRQKKDNHNMIERRRRFNINDRIKELGTIIPRQDSEMKQNKGTILKCTVDYIKQLRSDLDLANRKQEKHRETEELNAKLLLRVQELEMHCRAHKVPVTPLTNDTSTATLSSLLMSRRTLRPHAGVKQERMFGNDSGSCSMDGVNENGCHVPDDDGKDSMET